MSEHPSFQMLREYGLGLICPLDNQAIEQHLCCCEACRLYLVRLTPDQFTELFRSLTISDVSETESSETKKRFDELEEIGRGGMGVVYRARDRKLNRFVALKKIKNGSHASYQEQQRFLREAKITANLTHPGIVRIHEVGEMKSSEGLPTPYFAMELIEGKTLAQYLETHSLSDAQSAELIEKVALAIHAAHEHGILHRDLKSANILLADAEKDHGIGQPKIADFGLARWRQEHSLAFSMQGVVMGSPGYMSPEQIRGDVSELGPGTDIYSLGAILYECLTGSTPYRKDTTWESLSSALRKSVPSPKKFNSKISTEMAAICLKCLEHAPTHRYLTAKELADDLRRFLEHRPVVARPASVPQRMLKWTRRNPWPAIVLGTVALSLILIITGLSLHNLRLQQAMKQLESEKQRADLHFQQARKTIQDMLLRISGLKGPQLEGAKLLQSLQLEDACRFYENALRQAVDSSTEIQFDTASMWIELATLKIVLVKYPEAESLLQRADHLIPQSTIPSVKYMGLRMSLLNKLGSVYLSQGKSAEAIDKYEQALQSAEQLVALEPDSLTRKQDVAWAHHNIGAGYLQMQVADHAAIHLGKAKEIRHQLLVMDPSNDRLHFFLAESLVNLGLAEQQLGKFRESHLYYSEAECWLQKLQHDVQHTPEWYTTLASLLLNKGNLLVQMKTHKEAMDCYREGLSLIHQVLKTEPEFRYAKHLLLMMHGAMATMLDQQQHSVEAVKHWDEVVRLSDGQISYRCRRVHSLANASMLSRCLDEIASLQNNQLSEDEMEQLLHAMSTALSNPGSGSIKDELETHLKYLLRKLKERGSSQHLRRVSDDPILGQYFGFPNN